MRNDKFLIGALMLVLGIFIGYILFAQSNFGYGMMGPSMMGNMMNRMGGFRTGGGLFAILFLALIVVGAYLLLSNFGEGRRSSRKKALEILDDRLARGEIGKEEYFEMKENLEG
ncbi:MAG: SHOCT domain-containing protein [Candidatus Methanofastidiosia archaeon]